MRYEEQIIEKQKEIRKVQREIEDIEYGTEESMVEIELSDGTKVKTPKVLELYKKLDKLKEELRGIEAKKEECQEYIDKIKGIEEKEETRELDPEEIKYFHGQGDIVENTRDDRRANDEYFGFEGHRGYRKEPGPVKPDPVPPQPEPDPVPPRPTPQPSNIVTRFVKIARDNASKFFRYVKGKLTRQPNIKLLTTLEEKIRNSSSEEE